MEGRIEWHYWPMSEEQYREALAALRTQDEEPAAL
jgi:hypothetical protein